MTLENAIQDIESALADNARMIIKRSHFYGCSPEALKTVIAAATQNTMRIDPDPKLVRHMTPRGMLSFDDIYTQLEQEVEARTTMMRRLHLAEIEEFEDRKRMNFLEMHLECHVEGSNTDGMWQFKAEKMNTRNLREAVDKALNSK